MSEAAAIYQDEVRMNYNLQVFQSPLFASHVIYEKIRSVRAAPYLGSITSRFSGNEPALLLRMHRWTREDFCRA